MTSTPMDIDTPDGGSPANGAAPSLNISRTLGNLPSTSAITDVIANFRPTKVATRPGDGRGAEGFSRLWPRRSKSSPTKSYITAASLANDSSALLAGSPLKKCSVPDEPDEPGEQNHQAEGDDKKVGLSSPPASAAAEPDVDATEKPDKPCDATSDSEQQFKRDDGKDGRGQAHILSLDYDDPGELLMTSESDETIHIYKVREGRHDKQLLSQKYGVKLAKFTHASSSIVYASTKVNDAIRYLTTHDNTFVRYFEGHEAAVTCLAMHPGNDDFISCSKDNTVRLWNAGTKNATGTLYLNTPYLSAFDPSGQVFAVGSPGSGQVLIYDHRNFDKAPCSTFDIIESCTFLDPKTLLEGWTKLEFSNDGRNILLGTKGGGHFLLDSFNGSMRAYLRKAGGNTRGSARLAPGEDGSGIESSGDCCFTSDGRYVLGAVGNKVLVWDTLGQVETETKTLDPLHVLDNDTRRTGVLAFNPRFNFFATAEQDLVFWIPMEE